MEFGETHQARPDLQSSPTWGRGNTERLDQPSTIDLLVRDAEGAREAAARAEEEEEAEARAAAERRRARHESLAVEAEARRSTVMARELALQTAAVEKFSAEAKQERLLHKFATRMQAHVRGHQATSTLRVLGQVATVIEAGARGTSPVRAPALTLRPSQS